MISKFFNKLKSILGKKTSPEIAKSTKTIQTKKTPKTNKTTKLTKATKATKSTKATKTVKNKKTSKPKKKDSKLIVDSFTKLPGVGAKSAKALYEAGFKTPDEIISAKEDVLLAVPGVGLNLIKKLKSYKP